MTDHASGDARRGRVFEQGNVTILFLELNSLDFRERSDATEIGSTVSLQLFLQSDLCDFNSFLLESHFIDVTVSLTPL